MLPSTQDYKVSLLIGQDSFKTLQDLEVVPNPHYPDEPWYSTGGLAIVFKVKIKSKAYALKCFYVEANERQERLGHIATYLKQNPSDYFVDFSYLEDEIWVETANGGQDYPLVLMEWIEGKTLDNYLEEVCTQNNTRALKELYYRFCSLAWWLQQQPIAHGDLKHDNIIVCPDGQLKLIDYDGIFVPALKGRKANEQGSPCYQHPKRDSYFFNEHLDDFSLLILQLTLLALQQQPSLYTAHYNGDGILLKDTDYQYFSESHIKTLLWQIPEVKIPLLINQLQESLRNLTAIDLKPLLQDVAWINWLITGQSDSKLAFKKVRLKELILNDDRWKDLFIRQISHNYPLNERLLEKFKNDWLWWLLSENKALPWSEALIEKFKDEWYWLSDLSGLRGLSINKSLPWSEALIDKFKDKWVWGLYGLSHNKSLPWSEALIEKYKDKWGWQYLSWNEALPWSEAFVEKYKDKWDWDELSGNEALPWSEALIEKYKDKLGWGGKSVLGYRLGLSINEALPWSEAFIEKFKDKWDWNDLSNNEALPWSDTLLEKFKDKWSWRGLSSNKALPWSEAFIEIYKWKWNWYELSRNEALPWSEPFIEKYKDKWDWEGLSKNKAFPWSEALIEKFKDKRDLWGLSVNEAFPWSVVFIEKYENYWLWYRLSENEALPWSEDLIEKFQDKWDWKYLTRNEALSWSIELIEKYKYKWDWDRLRVSYIYIKVFEPLLDDNFIDEVMSERFKK